MNDRSVKKKDLYLEEGVICFGTKGAKKKGKILDRPIVDAMERLLVDWVIA